MSKRLLVITAHPDDEAFGPAGTIAKYADEGVEIHLLCATRGEAGQWHQKKIQNSEFRIKNKAKIQISEEIELHHVREKELMKSAKILGVRKVEFLDFIDGTLCNANYHQLAAKISKKINSFQPQVIMTMERLGVSGHLDHIAVSLTTTYAFLHSSFGDKLYYHCLPKESREKDLDNYFIYFPEGYDQDDITTRIDWSEYWDRKVKAMKQHQSQKQDVERILKRIVKQAHIDHFILQHYCKITPRFPETDLFAGIDGLTFGMLG